MRDRFITRGYWGSMGVALGVSGASNVMCVWGVTPPRKLTLILRLGNSSASIGFTRCWQYFVNGSNERAGIEFYYFIVICRLSRNVADYY